MPKSRAVQIGLQNSRSPWKDCGPRSGSPPNNSLRTEAARRCDSATPGKTAPIRAPDMVNIRTRQRRDRSVREKFSRAFALLKLGWPWMDRREATVRRPHADFRGFAQSGSNPGHPNPFTRLKKAKTLEVFRFGLFRSRESGTLSGLLPRNPASSGTRRVRCHTKLVTVTASDGHRWFRRQGFEGL
jgi:hypothetical protein